MGSIKTARGPITFQQRIPSHGNAASTGNKVAFVAPRKLTVTAVRLTPDAAITADGTNYAIYTVSRHTAGAAATTVATRSWIATNSVALTEETATLSGTAANLVLAAGDTLTVVKTVAASGLLIPDALLVVTYV